MEDYVHSEMQKLLLALDELGKSFGCLYYLYYTLELLPTRMVGQNELYNRHTLGFTGTPNRRYTELLH